MKIQFFEQRKFILRLCFGPIMWRCTNGRPNFRTEFYTRFYFYTSPTPAFQMPITPCLSVSWWNKSCLGSIEPLGVVSHTIGCQLSWLAWQLCFVIGRHLNTKTQAQVDASE